MNMPTLPRPDKYWKRDDEEIIFNAKVVVVAIFLGLLICLFTIGGK